MRSSKIIIALLLLATGLSLLPVSANAGSQRRRRTVTRRRPAQKPIPTLSMAPTEIKVLADVQRAGVPDPFVAVAYNSDTYKLIREMSPEMPDVDAETFQSRAVVAVFLGQRPTAGYFVNIEEVDGGLRISEKQPSAGTMVVQVLSSPLKVISIPKTADRGLNIQFDVYKGFDAKDYRVAESEFSFTGGFAGQTKKFSLGGTMRILRQDKFVSVLFDLKSVGADKPRELHTVATGIVEVQGKMVFGQVDPGTLIEFPYAPLRAEGTWTDSGVSFTFESLPPTVADGFEGKGFVKATNLPAK